MKAGRRQLVRAILRAYARSHAQARTLIVRWESYGEGSEFHCDVDDAMILLDPDICPIIVKTTKLVIRTPAFFGKFHEKLPGTFKELKILELKFTAWMKDRGSDDEHRPFAAMLEQNELDELIVQPPPGLNRFFVVMNVGIVTLSKTLRFMEFRSINFATYEKPFAALQICTQIEVIVFDWCYNVNSDMAKELISASFPALRSVELKDCFNMSDLKQWADEIDERCRGKSDSIKKPHTKSKTEEHEPVIHRREHRREHLHR
ncbi:8867_t:CDS:2 [Paraglomus occultum]|uniref:8867_t:CDS:1 n=1 Tax=Paraglomus occultum TaxID=144539 RepID=A0A9N9AZJ3_9GLOM|nr:8867_t:CDS:2 [Paraglomus occultum]